MSHAEETVPAAGLKPSQREFSREKVEKAKKFEGGNRAILVSRDSYVLDGHHQWLAARESGEVVRVIRLDAPIRDLITLAHAFPSSSTDAASAAPARSGPKKPRGVLAKKAEAEAKARADYFTPGNVVPSYGGFDRVLSYQPPDADGRWSVTVRAVEKQGDAWVDKPDVPARTHATPPGARELKAGPAHRGEALEAPTGFCPGVPRLAGVPRLRRGRDAPAGSGARARDTDEPRRADRVHARIQRPDDHANVARGAGQGGRRADRQHH